MDANKDTPADGSDDDAILAEVQKRFQLCEDSERQNRADALSDLKFLSGDQWPEQARRNRTADRQPCLTINKTLAFLHQITNDQRQNRPSIKVHPVDDDADVDTAEVMQGLIRHIEYASNADVAYDTAVNSAAAIGFGYFRIVTDYADDDSFDQDIRFQRIRNAFTVYLDPHSQEPDGSDAEFAIIYDDVSRAEFKRLYPDADASSISSFGPGDGASPWISEDSVRIAEYYRVEHDAATLVRLSNGESGWEDQLLGLPQGVSIVKTRQSSRRKVSWYKVTATDVLGRKEIPCKWIPVFPVYGEEIDIDGRVIRSGLVRTAKDPAQMYNFWMTAATEEVSLRPKAPYIGAVGQFEGRENEWAQANVRSMPYLEYVPKSVGGHPAPPPSRQPMADVPVGVLQMAMHASDDIKACTGIFDASLGARSNETSGRAIVARQRQGDVSNFHFADNLNRTIRHAGRCLMQMIPRIYDTERVVRIMGEDQSLSHAPVNKPMESPEADEKTGTIKRVLNDLTVGTYDVTVSAGPSYSTLRQEAADAMIQFGQSWPKLMDIAGDKVVQSMDWPGAEEIAERIARTIPPEIRDDPEDGQQQQPMPPQVQQFIQQAQAHIQQLEHALQESQSGIDKERVKAQSAENVARINAESRQDVEEIKGWIAMLVQHMQPPPMLDAAVASDQGPRLEGLSVSGSPNTAPTPGPAPEQAQMGQ